MTSGILWNHVDEIDDVDGNTSEGKSFKHKTKRQEKHQQNLPNLEVLGTQINQNNHQYQLLNVEVITSLKYLSNPQRLLDFCLIKCEVELDSLSTKDCVLIATKNNI